MVTDRSAAAMKPLPSTMVSSNPRPREALMPATIAVVDASAPRIVSFSSVNIVIPSGGRPARRRSSTSSSSLGCIIMSSAIAQNTVVRQ
jgi:hypothetical protein